MHFYTIFVEVPAFRIFLRHPEVFGRDSTLLNILAEALQFVNKIRDALFLFQILREKVVLPNHGVKGRRWVRQVTVSLTHQSDHALVYPDHLRVWLAVTEFI